MKVLVTGSRGAVGTVLCERIREQGGSAIGWDRTAAPPGDGDAAQRLVGEAMPDAIIHVALPSQPTGIDNEGWLVNEKWTADIARIGGIHRIPVVYVSTVMVFTNHAKGPFRPDSVPDETEGYGHSKLRGEQAACEANPDVRVARLGWQIGRAPGSNNMVHYLEKQFTEGGEIAASTKWLPATSFLEDTGDALFRIAKLPPGTYLIDSNTRWNFFEIVTAVNKLHGNRWKVRATEDFVYDQRMIDPRPAVPGLDARLEL